MAKFKVSYNGLHKRDSYEGLIDYLENKQDKVKFPNREAKFLRDSPQYQSLLSQGFTEVEEQQLNKIKEEQEEHAVIKTSNDTNETAKEVKVVASQTDKQLIVKTQSSGTQSQIETKSSGTQSQIDTKSSGSQYIPIQTKSSYTQSQPETKSSGTQSQIETKSTYTQAAPLMFDMTTQDNMSQVKQDIESVENTRKENKQQQEQRITRILENHLQNEATPDTTINFAHRMAMMASSGIKKLGQQLSSPSSEEPVASSSSLLLGDPRGKQDWYTMDAMPLKQGDPNKVFTPQTKQKPTLIQIDNAVEKSKPQQKTKRNDYEN